MSPHPARLFVFVALLIAWLLTARAGLTEPPTDFDSSLDPLPREELEEMRARLADPEDLSLLSPLRFTELKQPRATLSLGAFTERRDDGLRRDGGLILLNFPLELTLGKSRQVSMLSATLLEGGEDEGDDEREDRGEAEPLVSMGRAPALPLPPRLARDCVRSALRHHGLLDDERLDSLASRARVSASLPDLRLRATRATDASLRLSPTQYDPYRFTEGEALGHRLEATMSFRLDRLLFADQEVSIERIRLQRLEARSKLSTRVLRALFDWQRARAIAKSDGLTPEELLSAELRTFEAETTLAVLTGGECPR